MMLTPASMIYDEFHHIATLCADRIAISSQSAQFTYSQLQMLAIKCEYALNEQVGLNLSPVIVSLSIVDSRLYGLLMGIIKSGRAYFYMDPASPLAIKQTMIENIAPSLIIGDKVTSVSSLIYLDVEEIQRLEVSLVDVSSSSNDAASPCCLLQTSGTTKEARVVAVSHKALLHNIHNYKTNINISANDRLSLLTSPQFSAANAAIYAALLSGACLCPYSVKTNGLVDFIEWIQREQITILHLTPSLFRLLAEYIPKHSLSSIRVIKLGGELLYHADVELFKEKFANHCVLINGLGMSEAAGNIAHLQIDHDTVLSPETSTVPIGYALAGHEVRIVDEDGRSVKAGEMGEMVIRSAFLADGYWKDSQATATTFHKVQGSHDEIELHTRDLGCLLSDGLLVHLGRKDRLIKRLGFRVDLNLIESTLNNLEGVKNAVVYYTKLNGNHDALIACVQLIKGRRLDSNSIQQSLKQVLPPYMMPQNIYFMADFPLTHSGKVDRQSILINLKGIIKGKVLVKPRNQLEQQITLLWQEVLARKDIGVYDNFFELGGDSLRMLDFIARLFRDMHITYSVNAILTHQTIAQIVEDIQSSSIAEVKQDNNTKKLSMLKASLLTLQDGVESNALAPLVFIPGGLMTENELLLIAGLLPYLSSKRLSYGVRLNLLEHGLQMPSTVTGIATVIADCISAELTNDLPVLVGECIACTLTLEVAEQLAKKSGKTPLVILLNPWHPRLLDEQNLDNKPSHIVQYLQLLKACYPSPSQQSLNLVFAEDQARKSTDFLAWWSSKTKAACKLHLVAGDNHTYIRLYREELAHAINIILADQTVAGLKMAGGVAVC